MGNDKWVQEAETWAKVNELVGGMVAAINAQGAGFGEFSVNRRVHTIVAAAGNLARHTGNLADEKAEGAGDGVFFAAIEAAARSMVLVHDLVLQAKQAEAEAQG